MTQKHEAEVHYYPPRNHYKYNLLTVATANRYIFVEICKGMLCLIQAGLMVQELLKKQLKEESYLQD